jgi:hypothetical protein
MIVNNMKMDEPGTFWACSAVIVHLLTRWWTVLCCPVKMLMNFWKRWPRERIFRHLSTQRRPVLVLVSADVVLCSTNSFIGFLKWCGGGRSRTFTKEKISVHPFTNGEILWIQDYQKRGECNRESAWAPRDSTVLAIND